MREETIKGKENEKLKDKPDLKKPTPKVQLKKLNLKVNNKKNKELAEGIPIEEAYGNIVNSL